MKMRWDELLSQEHFAAADGEEISGRNDYETIICSTFFRRLQDKAQVFPLAGDDYVRTRLTHSLEVSAIGKKLGEYTVKKAKTLGKGREEIPEEISEKLLCAGLVHDIGNPPFGHFGEYAIREWFREHLKELALKERRVTELLSEWQLGDLYFFEGNAQSLRVLSKTPYMGRMDGFNLSYGVLASMIKYPVSSETLSRNVSVPYKKFGYYYAERQLFESISRGTGMAGRRHPLSFLLEAADDIAYRTSDLEDALVKKVIALQQILEVFEHHLKELECKKKNKDGLEQAVRRLKKLYREEVGKKNRKPELTAVQRWNQYLQEQMIKDAGDSFLEHYEALMQGGFLGELFDGTPSESILLALAEISEEYVYTSSAKTRAELFGRRVIEALLDQFLPAALVYDTGEDASYIQRRTMDTVSEFYKSMYHSEASGKSPSEKLYLRILMITDYISGMTDSYARRLYQELNV